MTAGAVARALAPLLGLAAGVVLHILLSRALPRLPRLHGLAASTLGGLLVVAALSLGGSGEAGPDPDRAGTALAHLLTYLLLTYAYVIGFFNLGESARRIRLVIELYQAGPRGLTLSEVLAAYNARTIVELRLGRMRTGGQVVERNGRYVLRRRLMLRAAKTLGLMKVVLLGGRSEFSARERRSGRGPGSRS